MRFHFITETTQNRRSEIVNSIGSENGNFNECLVQLQSKIRHQILTEGSSALLDHLRTCSSIPESFAHDSSQEKLYSKYTDAIICESLRFIGLNAIVLSERGDAADVEAASNNSNKKYSLVADAKAFRLSRTAKNQKDFKVQAMHTWKRDKDYALIVCPIYQLPTNSSQIYQQATTLGVCIFSYSHLAVLIRIAELLGTRISSEILQKILEIIPSSNPTKSAATYWKILNQVLLSDNIEVKKIWTEEKMATSESIEFAKEEGLRFLSEERTRILRMTHSEAIQSLIRIHKLDSRQKKIESIQSNNLLSQ